MGLNARQSDIVHAVYVNGGRMSRLEIARALQMSKHPKLIADIEELVDRGVLMSEVSVTNKGLNCLRYSIGRIE